MIQETRKSTENFQKGVIKKVILHFLDKLAIQSNYWITRFVEELMVNDVGTEVNNCAS